VFHTVSDNETEAQRDKAAEGKVVGEARTILHDRLPLILCHSAPSYQGFLIDTVGVVGDARRGRRKRPEGE
jgi:hypothetical protein